MNNTYKEVYKYYEIAATEDYYRLHINTVSKITVTKLWGSGYRVAVTVIVSKGKQWKIPNTRVIGTGSSRP